MLSRLQDFVSRHRRKLIITGVVVGGTFVALKYAQRKLIEFQEKQAREFLEKTRRLQHFESTERTSNQIILGMSTELYQAILRECNTTDLLERLRGKPQNKLDLWQELKIVAFTRLATMIYASSMLVIALRVQMNLLGGYLYRDITLDKKDITDEVKQEYLSLIRYFLQDGGICDLVRLIRSKVIATLGQTPLTKQYSLADMEQLFWTLQMAINSDTTVDPISKMSKYILPPNGPEQGVAGGGDSLLHKMYTETLDLLESDDAITLCSNHICRGFSIAVDAISENLGEHLFTNERQQGQQSQGIGADASISATSSSVTLTNTASASASASSLSSVNSDTTTVYKTATNSTENGASGHCDTTTNSSGSSDGENNSHNVSNAKTLANDGQSQQGQQEQQQQSENNNSVLQINSMKIPLAKVIPIISGITSKGFDAVTRPQNLPTSLITFFVVSEKCKVLGANIYETFSCS